MTERRRFIRFKIFLNVELTLKTKVELPYQGQVVEFSREGLRLATPSLTFSKDDAVQLKAYLPQRPEPIFLKGKIIWMRDLDETLKVGLRIESMRPEDKSDILDHAYRLWREKVR